MKISTFLYILLLTLLALQPARLRAQTYLLPTTGTASYTTCAGTLYDDGGPDNLYDTEARGSVTLRPGTAGGKIKLAFSLLELDSVRCNITVYDGLDTNAPYISRFYHGLPTVYATGSTGALTVVFSSYGGQARRGMAAAISCVTSVPATDLAAQNLRLSATSVPTNDYFTATTRVANLRGPLSSYRLTYLLSTDNVAGGNDIPLGTSPTWSLAQGDWTFTSLDLRVPTGTAPGSYYVLCEAGLPTLNESNYANNTVYTPLTVLAQTPQVDLTLTDATYTPDWPRAVGMPFYVSNRVQNLGRTAAVASQVGYYLSDDATLSSNDVLLSTEPAEVPFLDKYIVVQTELTLPVGTALGAHYLLSVADYDDQVIEDNEQNNVLAQPLTVVPPAINVGFESSRTVAPTQPAAGGSVDVRCGALNKSNTIVDSVTVGYYLSADRVFSADDILLDQVSVGPLWVSAFTYYSQTINRTLTIPVGTPPGKCYLLLVADHRNQLAETDESDNVAAIALDIVVPVVDLSVSSLRYNSTAPPAVGSLVALRYTLSNLGATQAYPFAVGYYLSTDNQLSADDVLLPQLSRTFNLNGGTSQVIDVYDPYGPFLPANTPPGTYYLLVVADHLGQLSETDETNNVAAVAIQFGLPAVDLSLAFKPNVLPAQASAGAVINLGYYLYNTGSTPAQTPASGFYLSADAKLSSDDILIGNERVRNTLYPNGSTERAGRLAIPPTIAPGKYYLLGAVDNLNEFAETDETNNVAAVALAITSARPDLAWRQTPYLTPKQAVAGSLVSTESYVYNVGAGLTSASTIGYYLSTDPAFSADDVLAGSTPVTEVRPGYSVFVEGTFKVPAATAGGRYYVLFVADHLLKLDDLDRSNNVSRTTITITPLPLATREQTAGYELQVSPVPAARATPLRVQLSGPGTRAEAALTLYNSVGQVVCTRSLALVPGQRNQAELPTTGLAAGVYILRLSGPSLNAVRRVVVE